MVETFPSVCKIT